MSSSIKLFNLLSEEYRLWMLEKCEIIHKAKGEALRPAGDQHHHIFIIVKGHVGIYEIRVQINDCPVSCKVGILHPGDIIGDNPAIAMQSSLPALCCEETVVVLKIDEILLDEKVVDDPLFASQLQSALQILNSEHLVANYPPNDGSIEAKTIGDLRK